MDGGFRGDEYGMRFRYKGGREESKRGDENDLDYK